MDGANRICYLIACYLCGLPSYHPQYAILKSIKKRNQQFFCGQKCAKLYYKKSQTINCETCKKQFEKRQSEIKKTKHHFCSKSCAAIYHNSHKIYGSRRSKLEKFIENKIIECFPNLKCFFNDIKTIGSEIDVYFPTIKLAIQFNGPLHYKPIYGQEKLFRIKKLDELKRKSCKKIGIELIEIDVSKDRNLDKIKDIRWQETFILITSRFIKRQLI